MRDAQVNLFSEEQDAPVGDVAVNPLNAAVQLGAPGKRHIARFSLARNCVESRSCTDVERTLLMIEYAFALLKRSPVARAFNLMNALGPKQCSPSPVARAVLPAPAGDAYADDGLWHNEPEHGKREDEDAERVHEPVLPEVPEVVVDKPEYSQKEYKGNQLSQCI